MLIKPIIHRKIALRLSTRIEKVAPMPGTVKSDPLTDSNPLAKTIPETYIIPIADIVTNTREIIPHNSCFSLLKWAIKNVNPEPIIKIITADNKI